MRFSLPNTLLALTLSFHHAYSLADDKKDTTLLDPCTVKSASGSFYDLRSLTVQAPIEGVKPGKNALTEDWHAKGHDYHEGNANFTLNICEPLIGTVEDVVGVEKDLWRNVSAVYKVGSKTYSIG
jgi:cation-dependent mannose-6-phosphate receptor